jgi:uroporphyrin-III C-methyltransferase
MASHYITHFRQHPDEVVFHDALIGAEILSLAPKARLIAVGKRSGKHSTAQRFINKRLLDAAQRYRVVVRLKGGDPMLFGRAHEEIEFLSSHRVPVEVIPGVTAALAASAELGVSLTQRLLARTVVFATPRTAPGATPSGWEKVVAAADTAALYMAAGEARAVSEALLRAGVPAETPVAIVESVSLAGSTLRAGALAQLAQLAEGLGGGPSLVLVGKVFAALQRQPERQREKGDETQQRPLGDGQAEERPVDDGALTGTLDQRR